MRSEYGGSPRSEYVQGLVSAIAAEVRLAEKSVGLILHTLDTWGKALRFNDWVKSQKVNGNLLATETEISRAAVQIAKACDAED